MRLSIIVPTYNEEEKNLAANIRKFDAYLKKQGYDYEVIVVDDGSTDNPKNIANNDGVFYFELYPDKEDYKNKYKDTITFINSKLEKTINNIIDNSDSPPIIIIQSDHGPGLTLDGNNIQAFDPKERLSIFNAYFVPEKIKEKLYDEITPINTFPIIFNGIFNDNIKLNEDASYMMGDMNPYLFYKAGEYPNFIN